MQFEVANNIKLIYGVKKKIYGGGCYGTVSIYDGYKSYIIYKT